MGYGGYYMFGIFLAGCLQHQISSSRRASSYSVHRSSSVDNKKKAMVLFAMI